MSNVRTPKKVYAASSHVTTSCCRLCKSVGDIAHSKNLFAKNNRALLAAAEELYGGSFSQSELLPRLICRPCERRVNNFKAFKNTITETQTSFERIKRCIEVSPSAPQALKSSKLNEPLVVRSRRGINFGNEQPSENKVSKAMLSFFLCFYLAVLTFSIQVNFFLSCAFRRDSTSARFIIH